MKTEELKNAIKDAVERSMEDIKAGRVRTVEQLRAKHPDNKKI
jgi:predicted transcriptional regulator